MRAAEGSCFRILERELGKLNFPGARLERRPIEPAIQRLADFSPVRLARAARTRSGLSATEIYAGRSNLLYFIPGAEGGRSGSSIAVNGHVDVVAPYLPPRAHRGIIHGRGACDDKGPVTAMVGALKVLDKVTHEIGLRLNRSVLGMWVIEEETGGNGSLSLAVDQQL